MPASNFPESFSGEVVHGKEVGRSTGYPTANIDYDLNNKPESGVFYCYLRGNGFLEPGLAVIGAREDGYGNPLFEVYLLYYHEDLYGQFVEIELIEKLRGVKKFDSQEKLIRQIEKDIIEAKEFFKICSAV